MYDECDSESKKMILSRLIQPVKVKRDYEIEIEFAINFHQLGMAFDAPEWGRSAPDGKTANQARGPPGVSAWTKRKTAKSYDSTA